MRLETKVVCHYYQLQQGHHNSNLLMLTSCNEQSYQCISFYVRSKILEVYVIDLFLILMHTIFSFDSKEIHLLEIQSVGFLHLKDLVAKTININAGTDTLISSSNHTEY